MARALECDKCNRIVENVGDLNNKKTNHIMWNP